MKSISAPRKKKCYLNLHQISTMVIRLSDDLTATEQRNIKDEIILALSKGINVDVLYGIG